MACGESDQMSNPAIKIVSAMKNIMWKGELGASIQLDTISDKEGLYGIGPVSYLRGEILINDGITYVSKVQSDTTMIVEKTDDITAPFFVYTNVTEWTETELPQEIKNIKDLEEYVDERSKNIARPFVLKLVGEVKSATIHIQNLAVGTKVSSPEEAHQGQVKYPLEREKVEIVGFFSTEHQGVFTHHDTYLHLHLMTQDELKMGHLDDVEFADMRLFLPLKRKSPNSQK